VTAAIFGLLGVVVGGLLTAAVDAWFRSLDTKRRLRHAARVLQDEIDWLGSAIDTMFETGDPRLWEDPTPVVETWRQRQDALSDLPFDDWNAVRLGIRNVNLKLDMEPLADATTDEVVAAAKEMDMLSVFTKPRERLARASEALERYVR
jgi:hypothetical protein